MRILSLFLEHREQYAYMHSQIHIFRVPPLWGSPCITPEGGRTEAWGVGAVIVVSPRGIRWRGRWEGGSGWGIHVNPRLIHVSVWQKPLQYCKVISLQLIKLNGKKKEKKRIRFALTGNFMCAFRTVYDNRSIKNFSPGSLKPGVFYALMEADSRWVT